MLYLSSVALILLSFCLFDRTNWLTLAASLVGATSLIFCAKGNPTGQALMIVFSLLYGIISFTFAYYGEMITYLGMTMPMAVFTLLDGCDLSGKVVKPFCTHEGSGLGHSMSDVRKMCPGADVRDGLAIVGSAAGDSVEPIRKWLNK